MRRRRLYGLAAFGAAAALTLAACSSSGSSSSSGGNGSGAGSAPAQIDSNKVRGHARPKGILEA